MKLRGRTATGARDQAGRYRAGGADPAELRSAGRTSEWNEPRRWRQRSCASAGTSAIHRYRAGRQLVGGASMKVEVSTGIEELKRQFSAASFTRARRRPGRRLSSSWNHVRLGPRYRPETTWMGFHIPAQYPYADIYPVFIGAECRARRRRCVCCAGNARPSTSKGGRPSRCQRRSGARKTACRRQPQRF